jgi:hypothetical protein
MVELLKEAGGHFSAYLRAVCGDNADVVLRNRTLDPTLVVLPDEALYQVNYHSSFHRVEIACCLSLPHLSHMQSVQPSVWMCQPYTSMPTYICLRMYAYVCMPTYVCLRMYRVYHMYIPIYTQYIMINTVHIAYGIYIRYTVYIQYNNGPPLLNIRIGTSSSICPL